MTTCTKPCPYQALHPERVPAPRCALTAPGHGEHACDACASRPAEEMRVACEAVRKGTRCPLTCDLCTDSYRPCDLADGHIQRGIFKLCRCPTHIPTEIDEEAEIARRVRARPPTEPADAGEEETPMARRTKAVTAQPEPEAHQESDGAATAVAEPPAEAPQGEYIPSVAVSAIRESRFNPRKRFADLDKLTEDVRRRGVIEPVLLRQDPEGPVGIGFELVAGARRFRATLACGRTSIPAIYREMDDREVADIQLVENVQRADLHPLEEAEHYARMIDEFKYSIEDVAARISKSPEHVSRRLKLRDLCPEAREIFEADKISTRVAVVLARIPDHDAQREAIKALRPREKGDDWPAGEAAFRLVMSFHTKRLKQAPFPVDDPELLPRAGACGACPHLVRNQPHLFDDVSDQDVCTKLSCWGDKARIHQAHILEEAEEDGCEVVTGKAASKVFPYSHQPDLMDRSSPYVLLKEKVDPNDWGPNPKTWATLLGKRAPRAGVVVAREDGTVTKLWRRTELAKVAAAHGLKLKKAPTSSRSEQVKRSPAEILKDKVNAALPARILGEISEGARLYEGDRIWCLLARLMAREAYAETGKRVARRRGLEGDTLRALTMAAEGMGSDEARALTVELMTAQVFGFGGDFLTHQRVKDVTEFLAIDVAAIRRDVTVELKAAQKAKGKAKPAAKAKGRKAAKGKAAAAGDRSEEE